jgi:hypothetical protein
MEDMTTSKTWGMLLDQDIIQHLENKDYLEQIVQSLMAKIQSIHLLSHNEHAKTEILGDDRVQRFLAEVVK